MKNQTGHSFLEVVIVLGISMILFVGCIFIVIRHQQGKKGQLEAAMLDARNAIRLARSAARIGLSDAVERTFDAQKLRLPAGVRVLTESRELPVSAPITSKCVFDPQSNIAMAATKPGEGWGLLILESQIERESCALLITKRPGPIIVYKRYGLGSWKQQSNLLY